MRYNSPQAQFVVLIFSLLISQGAMASNRERAYRLLDQTGVYLERMTYEEYVYSRSKKTELGDQVKLDASVRYQHDLNNYARLRFETDPIENRFDNKTSRFELVGGHKRGNFSIRVDSELNTNDDGGSSVGLDLDSRGTFISYTADDGWGATFYPFNFDSRVGREFYSYDVTRLYFIEGSPDDIEREPTDEKIAEKTIPGLEFNYRPPENPQLKFYIGAGLATYLYPGNPDFDILDSRVTSRWERRESYGYKAGITYLTSNPTKDMTIFNFQFSGHTESEETGSLLAQAATLNGRTLYNEKWFIDFELGYSKAGKSAYRVSRSEDWFETNFTTFQPVYADFFDNPQDWLGETDMAFALKLGQKYKQSLPYVFFRYQGEHFVFSERQSAHLLRTADESASHGGLTRIGFGTYQHYGNFTINPEFEWLNAKNAVFANNADVREDRVLSSFKKDDFLLTLKVSYNFDGDIFAQ